MSKAIREGKVRNIVVMSGAGISVSAGIPDFRSPGTGLYDNLQKYNLPRAEAIFDIGFFEKHPKAFCTLAKELYPGNFCPTPTHAFIRLLAEKKVLLRNYTQNIDTLEIGAGVPEDKLVQAHGGFKTAHCIKCGAQHSSDYVKQEVFADRVPACKKCEAGIVKPDIVFFGENLPERFHRLSGEDLPKCDLLLIMGTSLTVHPFAGLVNDVTDDTVRILFNREPVGQGQAADPQLAVILPQIRQAAAAGDPRARMMLGLIEKKMKTGLRFGEEDNKRDMFVKGDCDAGVEAFAKALGWEADLERIFADIRAKFKAAGGTLPLEKKLTSPTTQKQGRVPEEKDAVPTEKQASRTEKKVPSPAETQLDTQSDTQIDTQGETQGATQTEDPEDKKQTEKEAVVAKVPTESKTPEPESMVTATVENEDGSTSTGSYAMGDLLTALRAQSSEKKDRVGTTETAPPVQGSDKTNAMPILCRQCNQVILREGKGVLVEDREIFLHDMALRSEEKKQSGKRLRQFWLVKSQFHFENVGVTKATSAGDLAPSSFRYLCCSDCDLGPIGIRFNKEPSKFYVSHDRINYWDKSEKDQ